MHEASNAVPLGCWCAGVLLAGFGLSVLSVNFLPLYWSVGLVALFLAYFATCRLSDRRALPVYCFVIALAYSVLFTWAVATFTGVEKIEGFACEWELDAEGVRIDLRPIGGFGWAYVRSDALVDHLRAERPATVSVEVPIVRDFGRIKSRGGIHRVEGFLVGEP